MEWKAWIDSKLGTNFEAPVYDPQKGRDKLAKVIDTAAKQHSEGTTRAPNRTWKVGGEQNAIRFIPTLNGNPIMLDDGKPAFVPAEHFQKFLSQLKASVQKGDLDKEIKTALESKKGASSTTATRTATSKSSDDKFPKSERKDYDSLSAQEKRTLGTRWGQGKNPDNSLRADVGDKPNAPLAPSSNAK